MNAWVAALRELGGPCGPTYRVATIDDEQRERSTTPRARVFARRPKRLRIRSSACAIEHVIDDRPATKVDALLEKLDPLQQV